MSLILILNTCSIKLCVDLKIITSFYLLLWSCKSWCCTLSTYILKCTQDNRMNDVPEHFKMLPNFKFFRMIKHNYLVVYLTTYGVFLIHVNLKIVWIRSRTCTQLKNCRDSISVTSYYIHQESAPAHYTRFVLDYL